MEEVKAKKKARLAKKAGNSPIPHRDAACGHSGCKETCAVRFVGPVTNVRDHAVMHAARGASQVWTASIVAGLAVVLTGTIAYTSVRAQSDVSDTSNSALFKQMSLINRRLSSMEELLKKHINATSARNQGLETPPAGQPPEAPSAKSCVASCATSSASCMKEAQPDMKERKACLEKMSACQKACEPVK